MATKRAAKDWAELVGRWERSGLPVKEFAAAEGVVASTLSWWKWHLRSKKVKAATTGTGRKSAAEEGAKRKRAPTDRKKRASRKPQRKRKASDKASIQLVELVSRGAADVSEAPIELVVRGEMLVRVRRGFDAETLRRLLAVVGAGC